MTLPTYSIAIRTLGTSGEKFVEELNSILLQTVQPEKIIVYIAEGYTKPTYTIGKEEYVYVKKGMVAQRALPYSEIDSEYILLLDDDVRLSSDSAEKLLNAAVENKADCVGADTFKNQNMSLKGKLFAILSNFVYPRKADNYAFKICRNGSFSYNNNPKPIFYLSESCAGPAALWKKSSLLAIHLEHELWLDKLGFAFGDDVVEFYKLIVNGYKLGIHYGAKIEHLDAKSSSSIYQKNIQKFYLRSYASFLIWWRTCLKVHECSYFDKWYTVFLFSLKAFWLFFVNFVAGVYLHNLRIPYLYLKGLKDGISYVNSEDFKRIPNYILEK